MEGQVSLPRESSVSLGGRLVTFKKMPFGQYGRVMEAATDLFNTYDDLAKAEKSVISQFMGQAPEKVAKVISMATLIDAKDILDADPEEVIALFEEIFKLNNLQKILDQLKNIVSRVMAAKMQVKTEEARIPASTTQK